MSRCLLISPADDLIRVIGQELGEGSELRRTLVVFPGKRPGAFLRKALARQQGKAYLPPRVIAMDDLVELVRTDAGLPPRRVLGPMDAAVILFRIDRESPERIGGDHFSTVESFLPLGMRLFGELEELKLAGCDDAMLRRTVGAVGYGKIHLIPALYRLFYAEVERREWSTRAVNYLEAAAAAEGFGTTAWERIVIAGFFGLTPAEQRLFRAFARRDDTVFIFQHGPGMRGVLEKLDLDAPDPEAPAPGPVRMVRSPDTHGQIFALSEQIHALRRRGETLDERTVVVLPRPDALFPVLHETLSLLPEDSYNISLGYPLERASVVAWLECLLAVANGMHDGRIVGALYMRFLLHPYTKNILHNGAPDATRTLVHVLEEYFTREPAHRWTTLETIEEVASIFTNALERLPSDSGLDEETLKAHLRWLHDRTIRLILTPGSLGELAAGCVEALNVLFDQSNAPEHPYFSAFARRLVEELDALRRGLLAGERFASYESYIRLIRFVLQAAEVHFPGTPLRGLQVLGFLETRNLKFDRVFLLDANEDTLPGGTGLRLIPNPLRETLGLETTAEHDRRVEYSLSVLLRGAGEAQIFFVEDGKREKSRFVEKLLWDRQRRAGSIDLRAHMTGMEYALSLQNGTPQPVAKTSDAVEYLKKYRYSATALDAYLDCGRKFYFSVVLGLREREDVTEEPDARDVGTLVHDVLHDYFEPLRNTRLDGTTLSEERLAEVTKKRFDETFGAQEFGNILLLRRQVEKRLQEFLTGYQIPIAERTAIVLEDVETMLEMPLFGFRFGVRVDRIERRGETIAIIDYKTGDAVGDKLPRLDRLIEGDRTTWADGIGSVQLPLYAMLIAAMRGVPVESVHASFLMLGKGEMDEKIERTLFDRADDPAKAARVLENTLQAILHEISDPNESFRPPADLSASCPRCPFSVICGTQWVKGWEP